MTLTQDQRERYARNILIPGVGEQGQASLRAASVCVVGLGGLGSSAALYLAAAGVGRLGLVDPDVVELSNLQRQVIHSTDRRGQPKVASAAKRIRDLNPEVETVEVPTRIDGANAVAFLRPYDVVAEATDSFDAKLLLNDACVQLGSPLVTAGVLATSGQAMLVVPGRTPCMRCLIPEPPAAVPTTAEQGALGAVCGVLGSIEALEIVRWIVGMWTPPSDGSGRLHSIDGTSMRLKTVRVSRRSSCRCRSAWRQG